MKFIKTFEGFVAKDDKSIQSEGSPSVMRETPDPMGRVPREVLDAYALEDIFVDADAATNILIDIIDQEESSGADIASDWDFNLNDKSPELYLPKSNKKVNWVCKYGHRWNCKISTRTTQYTNCPHCFVNESWCENYIYSVVSKVVSVDKLYKPEIDIYIPSLNIGIEYDGYYHKFKYQSDIQKK